MNKEVVECANYTKENNIVNIENVEKFDVDTFNPSEDEDGQYSFLGEE